jgi:regulator of sigma E protease
MPYLFAVLALILLVVLHELGHFLAARAVGVRATKFYIFFPPAVYKRQIGDVEFGIGALPLGGFVKLPGMFRPEPAEVAERLRFEYEEVLPLVDGETRLRLDAARREIANAEHPDGLTAPLGEIRDGIELAVTQRTDAAERKRLDTARERVLGIMDDAHEKAYWRASLWRRMTVIFAGPFVNLVVAFVVLTTFWWALSPKYEITGPLRINEVVESSPAADAGLTADSRIEQWNGKVVGVDPFDLQERIAEGLGEPTKLTWVDADGDRQSATIVPKELEEGEDPRLGLSPALGGAGKELDLEVVGRTVTDPQTGVRIAYAEMREITVGTFTRLPRVFFDSEVREDVGSVVGIVQVAGDVDRAGMMIRYIAIISLVLAVMNLLPLLPLDGGHLLFGILEAIRRRPMPRAAFERYSFVGLAFVLVLFFIGLDNDIARARG